MTTSNSFDKEAVGTAPCRQHEDIFPVGNMKTYSLLLAVGLWSPLIHVAIGAPESPPPTQFFFVRHAETMANRTGVYNKKTINVLTERGEKQRRGLTRVLRETPDYDVIVVSPITRARKTILPYLREKGIQAEVWPSLAECCHQKDRTATPSPTLPLGKEIEIPPEDAPFLTLEHSPGRRRYWPANYADGMTQIQVLFNNLKLRFQGTGLRVLLVSHSIIGSRLLEILMGLEPRGRFRMSNCKISHLVEQPDGSWRLERLNDGPPPKEFR